MLKLLNKLKRKIKRFLKRFVNPQKMKAQKANATALKQQKQINSAKKHSQSSSVKSSVTAKETAVKMNHTQKSETGKTNANQKKKKTAVNLANSWLEQYEIKHPEYDYLVRENVTLKDKHFAPARYHKQDAIWKASSLSDSSDARLMFVGDITCFGKQFIEAQNGHGYDFSYEFDLVKDIFAKADLVCGNLETMIVPEAPYKCEKFMSEQSYYCNAPLEFLDALRKANFDALTTANNHDLDAGAVGIGETIDHIEQFGFIQTGTFKSDKPRYELIDVKGYRIALVAFATEHNGKAENLTQKGGKFLLNTYNATAAKKIIQEARAAGAELVFVCIHWGTEHQLTQDAKQERIAKELASMGCDCIIGSHPHVLQPYATVTAEGKTVPVFYSMGNFICSSATGNQSRSIIACIDLKRNNDEIQIQCSYIPTVTSADYGDRQYVVLPVNPKSLSPKNTSHLARIKKVVGNKIAFAKDIDIPDYCESEKQASVSRKKRTLDLTQITRFPVIYDDGNFKYSVFKKHIRVDAFSDNFVAAQTLAVPNKVLGLPVTEIKEGALLGNQITKRVNFRAATPVLSKQVCKNWINLEGFQLDSAIKEIDEEAFANCVNLSGLVLKSGCTRIGKKAFANCINLKCVKISSNVTYIADDAFEGCSQAIFYCAKGSYTDCFAQKHGFSVVHMPTYPTYANETVPLYNRMGPCNQPDDKHPAPIIAACHYLGKPLPESAKYLNPPSYYIGKDTFDGKLESIQNILGDKMPKIEEDELKKLYKKFLAKYHTQKIFDFNTTDFTVYFCDWILFAKPRGFSHDNYFDFELYNKESDIRDTFLNEGFRIRVRKVCNQKDARAIMANKGLFNSTFHEFVKRDWLDASTCSFAEFKVFAQKHDRCFAKPICGTGGSGARIVDLHSDTVENLFKMCQAEGLIVEEIIKQHPTLAEFNSSTLNTVRVNTLLCADGTARVLLTVARFGRSGNVVDNFHSGGVGAIVDIETGRIITQAINQAHQRTDIHPDSKKEFIGFLFPEWEKIKDSVCSAAKLVPSLRHVGWDVAVTADGNVEFVEGNARPNFDVLQSPDQLGRLFRYTEHIEELERQAGIKSKKMKPLVIDIEKMQLPTKQQPKQQPSQDPETPFGPKISGITKEGIEFYWKKVEVADGYEVFRGYKITGPFERIAVIPKRNIGTYIDADFDRSKKHVYYTVRSFLKDADGTCIYSEKIEPTEATFRKELVLERNVTYLYSGTARTIRAFHGWGEVEDALWTSSNEAVATISPDGTITAISSGECVLTCTSRSLRQNATSKVVVDRKACEPLTEIVSRYQYDEQTGCWKNPDAPETNSAVIMMVGDMMCGKRQMTKQFTNAQGWNFNDSFTYVKEITASSDFAIGNLETLLASGWPYMAEETYINNMNNCNATSRYLDAVRYGGFDAVAMANNHNCDGGRRALIETLEQVDKYKLARTGAFHGESDKRFFIADINGIKVGYVAYISSSTGFNGKDADWESADVNALLNVFTAKKAKKDIADCRAAGAEYVVAYMHWGYKNFKKVAQHQLEEAVAVAEAGADYIVGANPHMVQRYDVIRTRDGRKVPCAYSVGNFQAVMNQVEGNRDSVILRIRLERDVTGKIVLRENQYIPCHTYDKSEGNRWTPVAVSDAFNPNVKKKQKKTIRERIAAAMGDQLEMI